MAKSLSYLRHAIAPPKLDAAQAPRPRLTKLLNDSIDKRLIVIAAPAGFGKTTLLAEFGAHADRPVCWARLVEADQDVMRLAGVVWATLEKRFRRLRGAVRLESLVGASPRGLGRAIGGALGDHIEEDFVLALDDVHWINVSEESRGFLVSLIDSAPPGMTVLAAGRELPDIPLVKLLASDQLLTLDGDSLALRADELAEVVSRRTGETLTEADVAGLMEETGGWVTGVLLSERLVGKRLPSLLTDGQPLSYEYLASVVFDRQPEPIQRFLLDSSVLPVMTAELCDAVLERHDSQAMLNELLKRGLFITVTDDRPRTYEYHQLFKDYLAQHLRSEEQAADTGLFVRAVDQLVSKGNVEAAIEMCLEKGDYLRAAGLADTLAPVLARSGRASTLYRWFEAFRAMPFVPLPFALSVECAYSLNDQGRRMEARKLVLEIWDEVGVREAQVERGVLVQLLALEGTFAERELDRRALEHAIKELEQLQRATQSARPAFLRLKSILAGEFDGDWGASTVYLKEAIDIVKQQGPAEVHRLGGLLMNHAKDSLNSGDIEASILSTQIAMGLAKEGLLGIEGYIPFNNMATLLQRTSNYSAAVETLREAEAWALATETRRGQLVIGTTWGDVWADQGQMAEARKEYRLALELSRSLDEPKWTRYILARMSRTYRLERQTRKASEVLSRAGAGADGMGDIEVESEKAAILARADPKSAVILLRSMLAHGRLTSLQKAYSLLSMVAANLGLDKPNQAAFWLRRAWEFAGAAGIRQVVACEIRMSNEILDFVEDRVSRNSLRKEIKEALLTEQAEVRSVSGQVSADSNEKPGLEIQAIGPPRVFRDGMPLEGLARMDLEILVYLAHQGPSHRDRIAEDLWPEASPTQQSANLHSAIYRLRKLLGRGGILFTDKRYAVAPELRMRYDGAMLLNAVGGLQAAKRNSIDFSREAREILDMWRGSFMEGFDRRWIEAARTRVDECCVMLALNYARCEIEKGHGEDSLPYLRRALRIDPYHEGINRLTVEILGRAGRPKEMASHYERYRRALAEDLALDVPKAIRDSYSRLLKAFA